MTGIVVDFSAARPSRAQLVGAGVVGVCRYLKKDRPNSFDLEDGERANYLAWGIGILYNAEQNAGDLTTQPTSFFHDYGQEVAGRLAQWGAPTSVNVPVSCDTGVAHGSKQLAQAMNNYSAFAAAVAPFGMIGYAQTDIIDLLVLEQISPIGAKHWLPSAIGWSPGYRNADGSYDWARYLAYPHAGLVQRVGASPVPGTDLNTVVDVASMGFEWPAGSPYAPKKKDTDMPLFHASDGQGHTFYTDGLVKTPIVSGTAETGAQAAIKAGSVIDGSAFFPPDQILAMPTAGGVTVTIPPVEVNVTGSGGGATPEEIAAIVDKQLTGRSIEVSAAIGTQPAV